MKQIVSSILPRSIHSASRAALILALLATAAVSAEAQLFTYQFPGSDPGGDANVPSAPAGITLTPFSRVNLAAQSAAEVFSTSGFGSSSTVDLTKYITFSITANTPGTLDLTSLTFDASRSTAGPSAGQVSLFINGSATATESFTYTVPTATTTFTFNFADLSGITSAQFRFYGASASAIGGTLRLDNVSAFGALEAVPEPSTWAMMLAGAGLLGATQRWRRRRS